MARKHIITLSGKPGSGKSSTADKVAELLGYTRYSSGDFVRKYVRDHGMTLEEFNQKAASDHALDEAIDEELRKLRNENDIIVDSRLGFYWIPEAFKVYLDLDMGVATARIYKDAISNAGRGVGVGNAGSLAEAAKQVRSRLNAETRRFKSMYGVDPFQSTNFDLIINTSRHSPQTVALTVFDHYKKWLKTKTWQQVHSEVPMGYSYKTEY